MMLALALVAGVLAALPASGQDSLDVRFVRNLPGGAIIDLDDHYRVGYDVHHFQDLQESSIGDSLWVVIYDNREPPWSTEIWRGLPVVGYGTMGVFYDAFELSDAIIKDSVLYALQSSFNVYDTPGWFLNCRIVCYDWRNEDTLSFQNFEWRADVGWPPPEVPSKPFTYPGGMVMRENGMLAVSLGVMGAYIYDYSDPRNPSEIGVISQSCGALVEVGGKLAAVAIDTTIRHNGRWNQVNPLLSLKLLNWDAPQITLDSIPMEPEWEPLVILRSSGSRLFWNDRRAPTNSVWAANIEDEFNGVIEIRPDSADWIRMTDFTVNGDSLLLSRSDDFELWNISNLDSPAFLGRIGDGDEVSFQRAAWHGEWIYRFEIPTLSENPGLIFPYSGFVRLYHVGPVGVERKEDGSTLNHFLLSSPYPNPFNARVTVPFDLPNPGSVTASAFTVDGRMVWFSRLGELRPGPNQLHWNAAGMPSGSYIIQLESAGTTRRAAVELAR